MILIVGCHEQNAKPVQIEWTADAHHYQSIFGEEYYATGIFLSNQQDSIESRLWYYTSLARPKVIYGYFTDGLLTGDWSFVLGDGRMTTSKWSSYHNCLTACAFSLPFVVEENTVDSIYFKLRTQNDSLGKISIIVGVRKPFMKDENLAKFGPDAEIGLTQQGYTFTSTRKEIKKGGVRYFFTEYFMKDSSNRDVKLYNLYGNSPSGKHFVEFTLFHSGPKEDLVKIIFNLMVTNLYVGSERFYNPYEN